MNAYDPKPFTPEGPQPLIREVPDAGPYPIDALGPLRSAAEAITSITEAPPALCAASVLGVASLATQGLADVETLGGPRPLSLFLLTVAESGERKSTADRLAMQGVRAHEASRKAEYEQERERYDREHAIWEKQYSAILRGADKDEAAARADLHALGPRPEAPLRPMIVTGSATMEGIVKHLPELSASLGIMTDEGGLLLGGHSMKAENRLNTLATLAAMWDGSILDRWRAGDGVASYSGRRFSCHLLIQPSAAEAFLSDDLANGQGLLARFLTCRPASTIGTRLDFSRKPVDDRAVTAFAERIENLLGHPMALVEDRRNELAPPVLALDDDARSVLVDFAREVEKAQARGGVYEDARAFASKTAEHAARIAGVMTIFTDPDASSVKAETIVNAVTLAIYYAGEAVRLQSAAIIPEDVLKAERMRVWLTSKWSEDFISAAIAAQYSPIRNTPGCRKALGVLEAHGWLIEATGAVVAGKPRREAWKIVRQ